jgi:hypothetical protein
VRPLAPLLAPARPCSAAPLLKDQTMSASFRLIRLGLANRLTQAALAGLYPEDFMPGRYMPA